MARRDDVRVPRALRGAERWYLDIAARCCSLRDRCGVPLPGTVAPRSRHGLATLHSATDDNRTGRSDASTHRRQSSRQAAYASLWT